MATALEERSTGPAEGDEAERGTQAEEPGGATRAALDAWYATAWEPPASFGLGSSAGAKGETHGAEHGSSGTGQA